MGIVSFASHLWSEHLHRLKKHLHAKHHCRKVIVVGGALIKEKIMQFLVEKEGIAFGIKVLDLSSAMDFFHHICEHSYEMPSPTPSLLAAYLEMELDNIPELASYLQGKEKRKQLLADRVAKLFVRYSLYDDKNFQRWETQQGWQQTLWRKAKSVWGFSNGSFFKEPSFPMEVHLFGLPYIPPVFQKELIFLANHWEIYAYHFSPSGEYWEDLCTAKEEADTEFGEFGHPLLANFGSLGRQMFDFYQIPLSSSNYPITAPNTLLDSLKNDIASLQITPFTQDDSLQLHLAPNRKEEVEGVYKSLLSLIASDASIKPDDVIVYAPDISQYFPYIQWVFGRSESLLGFTIDGVNVGEEVAYGHCLLHFFSLIESRWDVQDVLKIFHFSPLLKRFGFSKDDVAQIRDWVMQAGIRWGKDLSHQEQFLGESTHRMGTWEEGFDRLLIGLSTYCSQLQVEFSAAALLGKFLFLIEHLFADLQFMRREKLSICDWVFFVRALKKSYLVDEPPYVEEALCELSAIKDCKKVGFTTVYRFLEKLFSRQSGTISHGTNRIRFSSLKMGNICHTKVLWVMGMDENAFPRGKNQDHLDALGANPTIPNPNMEDRFAGLETLLWR